MAPPELPPKKDVMLALLERSSVFIHLDPRREDVRVPLWFKKQPQLVLQIGLNMAVRIPDLAVEDDAVSCTLSFSRSPFFCYLPWSSVFALVADDGKGMLWPSDVPKEVAAQQAEQARKDESRARLAPAESAGAPRGAAEASRKTKAAKPRTGKKPARSASRPDRPDQAAEQPERTAEPRAAAPGGEPKRPLPPYLRVVK